MNRATWLQDRRMQKFRDVLSRWEAGELSMMEAGELLGVSERQFRRYRDRYEEDGLEGLLDGRLGKPSPKRVPERERDRMLELYREVYRGWNVKHFYEHLRQDHGFRWGYTWVKTQLHTAGLVERAKRRGAHRRKRERKPCEGMMLHQDGSRAAWLNGQPALDLIVTMDDATSTIYSAFLVDEERLTQVGRALDRLGIEHIAAYSPEARGRSERMFGTLQDRLIKELAKAGITEIAAANTWIRDVYLPDHNARFARPAAVAQSAFVAVGDATMLSDILCIQEERVVDRANTVSWGRQRLQLPESPLRPHFVKARVRVHEYPDGALAVFHGPRCIARYNARGAEISEVPTCASVTPCSPPSRTLRAAAGGGPKGPSLTAAARGVTGPGQVGTKKRPSGRTKKLTTNKEAYTGAKQAYTAAASA